MKNAWVLGLILAAAPLGLRAHDMGNMDMGGMKMDAAKDSSATTEAGSTAAQEHSTTGVIIKLIKKGDKVTIDSDKFGDGFMGAMTMTLSLASPKLAKGLKAGDKVKYTVKLAGKDQYVVTAIAKVHKKGAK